MKNAVLSILAVCVSITMMSCGASQEITSFWKNPEMPAGQKYSKVFIAVLTVDRGARNTVETDLAAVAKTRGICRGQEHRFLSEHRIQVRHALGGDDHGEDQGTGM